jgi:hypothetical protein
LILVTGHMMVGVGYDQSKSLMYVHDTWGYEMGEMEWGGSYGPNLKLFGLGFVRITSAPEPPDDPDDDTTTYETMTVRKFVYRHKDSSSILNVSLLAGPKGKFAGTYQLRINEDAVVSIPASLWPGTKYRDDTVEAEWNNLTINLSCVIDPDILERGGNELTISWKADPSYEVSRTVQKTVVILRSPFFRYVYRINAGYALTANGKIEVSEFPDEITIRVGSKTYDMALTMNGSVYTYAGSQGNLKMRGNLDGTFTYRLKLKDPFSENVASDDGTIDLGLSGVDIPLKPKTQNQVIK